VFFFCHLKNYLLYILINEKRNSFFIWEVEMVTDEARDLSLLDPRFTQFYESGERVEVFWKNGYGYGEMLYGNNRGRSRFYVGRSTGWLPVYLMLARRDSSGGMAINSEGVESIRGLGVYR
jgi:hypothetical protein